MKKYQSLTISFFYVLLLGFQFWGLSACRKTSTFTDKPVEGKIIFSYNGTKYVLPYNEVTKDWNIESGYGIFINRLDIFKGIIHFPNNNCAYLDPSNNIAYGQNCQLTVNGAPIDSVAVYLYQSGQVNVSYKDCKLISYPNFIQGGYTGYYLCNVDGAFNLILKNKENKIISITDGSIQLFNYKKF